VDMVDGENVSGMNQQSGRETGNVYHSFHDIENGTQLVSII
jgi:hypothetical protein